MLDSLRQPLVKSLGNALDNLSNFKMTQTEIYQLSNFNQLQIALKSVPKIQFPELASAISNIPTPALDIQNIVSPLNHMVEVIAESNIKLAETFYSPLLQVEASIRSFMTSIDFSLLTYRREWNKGRETLLGYGWFYSRDVYKRQALYPGCRNVHADGQRYVVLSDLYSAQRTERWQRA